eukprot:XP_011669595.1 PREDICTED: uncharacterized protein LOC105440771 [Strongylocentrotus purpuratus]
MALPKIYLDVPRPTESSTMIGIVDPTTVSNFTSHFERQPTAWWDIILVTLWIIIVVIGVVGNSLVFLAIAVSRSLQTRSNILVVNVLVADIVVCCLLPLQSATLLLADAPDGEGALPTKVCAGVATLATMCLWSRMATFGVLSHQQWKQQTKSRSLWASIHKRKRPLIVASLTWLCPLVAILVPRFATECIHLGYSNETKLCVFDGCDDGCDESQLIFRIVTPLLWLLTVLFTLRNYSKIHIHEINRRKHKYVPRKKRRPTPRRDPDAYLTPSSPFEEVQLARPVTSFKKGKGKQRKQPDLVTPKQEKVSKSPKFVVFSRGKGNKSKPVKEKVPTRDRLPSNPVEVSTITKELRMMFSKKQEPINSEPDTFRPSTIRKLSENGESQDEGEVDQKNDRNQNRNSMKLRIKLDSFVQSIHWKKSSTETMVSDVSQEEISDVDNMDDCDDDDDDDDGVINEIALGGAEETASMKMYSSPNVNMNKTHMHGGKHSAQSYELQLIGSSRISSRGTSRRQSSPSDYPLSVSQLLSLLTIIYLVLVPPKLVCMLLPSCPSILYKLAETIYVSLSALIPFVLASKHQTFSVVITGLVYRRWKSIPQPSMWIVRLCKIEKDVDDYGDGDCQL